MLQSDRARHGLFWVARRHPPLPLSALSDDEVGGDDDNRQVLVKQQFWLLVRTFNWFSLFFVV